MLLPRNTLAVKLAKFRIGTWPTPPTDTQLYSRVSAVNYDKTGVTEEVHYHFKAIHKMPDREEGHYMDTDRSYRSNGGVTQEINTAL